MKKSTNTKVLEPLVLKAETAEDLMTPNPISINAKSTVKEAVAFLTDKGFSAAPVVDDGGRPVGVISQTDIVIHDREKVEYLAPVPEYYDKIELATSSREKMSKGFQVENVDSTPVRDIMTPVVFSVAPADPASTVVEQMTSLRVHRLFVVDDDGVLVGVISALDVVGKLL